MNANLITGCFIAAFFMLVSLPSDILNNWPYPIKQQSTGYGKDNIFLKDNLCFAQDRDFTNQDLNHFCKGTKQWTSN